MRTWFALAILCGACVDERGRQPRPDGGDPQCSEPLTFFEDHDHDGHGDPALAVTECTQPTGTVLAGDDCDDANPHRHPGTADVCDGIDNDCNASSLDLCPAGCSGLRRPEPDDRRIYLFCTTEQPWVAAATDCVNAGGHLAEIDSQEENDFIRTNATALLGAVDVHIGANDRDLEESWVWDGGELFWTGGPSGSAFNGRFEAWDPAEPDAADGATSGADCGALRADGLWFDSNCGNSRRYVCRL